MSVLNVDYVALRNSITCLSDLLVKIGAEVNKIIDYTKDLDLFWDGAANTAYVSRVGEDISTIAGISLKVRDTIRILGLVLDVYMENEKEIGRITGEYVS